MADLTSAVLGLNAGSVLGCLTNSPLKASVTGSVKSEQQYIVSRGACETLHEGQPRVEEVFVFQK